MAKHFFVIHSRMKMCMTPKRDMAESTCDGVFAIFKDCCKVIIVYVFKLLCESFRPKFES